MRTEFLRAYLKSLFVDKKQVASHARAQCLIVSHRLRAPLPVAILFLLSPSSPEPVCGFWKVKADNRQVATLAVVTGWGHGGSIKPGPGHGALHWPGNPGLAENLEWCCYLSSDYPVKWTDWISRRKLKRLLKTNGIYKHRSTSTDPHPCIALPWFKGGRSSLQPEIPCLDTV